MISATVILSFLIEAGVIFKDEMRIKVLSQAESGGNAAARDVS